MSLELSAWRITRAQYADLAFDGEGARRYGGRFNRKGTPLIYTASSLALAMLEVLVHVDRTKAMAEYVALPVSFETEHVRILERESLPDRWNAPRPPVAVQEIGEAWVKSSVSPILQVPSVLLPEGLEGQECNYLINPLHRDFHALQIGSVHRLVFDGRLFD